MNLDTESIEFTMACPQAKLKTRLFMEIPWGFQIENEAHSEMCCMELLTNWCGLRDGGLNWFECIKSGLQDRGFQQSQIDPCLLTRGGLVIVLYVDDVIIVSKQAAEIENLLASLKNGTDIDTGQLQKGLKKFFFTDDGAEGGITILTIVRTIYEESSVVIIIK